MKEIRQGRWTAEIEGDFVVFLIGARFNSWRHPLHAIRALGGRRRMTGMSGMLNYLMAHPEKGLLGYETMGFALVQYWRSFDQLEAFARDKDDPHLATWRNYWKTVGSGTHVGIWHETFLVRTGEYEAVYGNMPPYGLAKASRGVTLAESSAARQRIRYALAEQ
jgi:hypothetical protein